MLWSCYALMRYHTGKKKAHTSDPAEERRRGGQPTGPCIEPLKFSSLKLMHKPRHPGALCKPRHCGLEAMVEAASRLAWRLGAKVECPMAAGSRLQMFLLHASVFWVGISAQGEV